MSNDEDECCDFDLERIKKSLEGPFYRLPPGPLTKEQIRYYMSHPEECELIERDGAKP